SDRPSVRRRRKEPRGTPPNGLGRMTTSSWASPRPHASITTPGGTSPAPRKRLASTGRRTSRSRVDLRRTLDHAAAATQVYGPNDFHAKNAIALGRLRTEFKGKIEIVQLPVPVLRELKKLAVEVVKEESEKTPMARKVHASFTKFQALVGPWDHVAEGAYHQFVAGWGV